jgi:hypothetical protein
MYNPTLRFHSDLAQVGKDGPETVPRSYLSVLLTDGNEAEIDKYAL